MDSSQGCIIHNRPYCQTNDHLENTRLNTHRPHKILLHNPANVRDPITVLTNLQTFVYAGCRHLKWTVELRFVVQSYAVWFYSVVHSNPFSFLFCLAYNTCTLLFTGHIMVGPSPWRCQQSFSLKWHPWLKAHVAPMSAEATCLGWQSLWTVWRYSWATWQ